MPRRRRGLLPGPTAKNNKRHFVRHDYHDLSSSDFRALLPTIGAQKFNSISAPKNAFQSLSNEDPPNGSPKILGKDDAAHPMPDGNVKNEAPSAVAPIRVGAAIDRPKKPRKGPRGGVAIPFPEKLFAMLSRIEKDGFSNVISWQPHGRCFVIHQKEPFVEHIMPLYFRQTKLSSFQRQLNLYGFSRLTSGKDKGGYYHQLFLRGRPSLCKGMLRTKVKGTGIKPASSPESEPDFYSMPYVWELKEQEKEWNSPIVPNHPNDTTNLPTHLKKEVGLAGPSSTSEPSMLLPTTRSGSNQSSPKYDNPTPSGPRAPVSENLLLKLRTTKGSTSANGGPDWRKPGVGSKKCALIRQQGKEAFMTRDKTDWNPQEGNENYSSSIKRIHTSQNSSKTTHKGFVSHKRQRVHELAHGFHLREADDQQLHYEASYGSSGHSGCFLSHFYKVNNKETTSDQPKGSTVEKFLTLEAASALMNLHGCA